jgi:two-component system cell cycle sensor histidine kinase/response regulator CckA
MPSPRKHGVRRIVPLQRRHARETEELRGADVGDRRVGAQPGPYVMLAVGDTGAGMGRETLSHAFEPFYTTKGPGKGTGLGLSTVYGIVKQSGGDLWLYSEPGHGTTVKIYLPRLAAGTAETAAHPGLNGHPDTGTETILLVEDDDALRALSRKILVGRGYTVLEACDGQAALGVYEQHAGRIDLLATDVVMPGIGGRVLVERITARAPGI